MRKILGLLSLVSALAASCASSAPDNCAFRARDGSCAVVASSTGALECRLEDSDLCNTVTAFIESRDVGVATSALIKTGGTIGGTSLVCEPDGTFMCTCCGVKTGCYPCPKKAELTSW